MRKIYINILGIGALGVAAAILGPSSAAALQINPTYDPSVPAEARTLIDGVIANWEASIKNGPKIGVEFKFAVLDPTVYAQTENTPGDSPTSAVITFNSVINNWFWDPTPFTNQEFDSDGIAIVNGPADGKVDGYTIAKHELCHAVGFSKQFNLWNARIQGGVFRDAQNNVKATMAAGDNSHLDQSTYDNAIPRLRDLMIPVKLPNFQSARVKSSSLDLQMLADAYGYDTNPKTKVPLLSGWGWAILSLGLAMAGAFAARRRLLA